MNHFIFIYFITLALMGPPVMAASKEICSPAELAKFRELYINLQQKLNYEGTDAYLENGKIKQKKHTAGTDYGGKIFEDALFLEYQNSLRKVAMLFQTAKNRAIEPKESNNKLIEFFNVIESKDATPFILSNNINDVIEQLQSASVSKYTDSKDKKFIISDNDKYLLKRLLTHAQDRIISVQEFKNKDQVHFKKEYLQQVSNAPLTRLINVIKNAKITANSNIAESITEIAQDKRAMSSAITANLNDLRKWLRDHQNCRQKIKDPNFIQGRIQIKNYNKFLDALTCKSSVPLNPLDDYNANNLEAVLHFINSNERFLNKPGAAAETAMDELKLEAAIDQTFVNLGNKIGCIKIDEGKGQKKYFVQNLPYKDNKFDTSKILCSSKGKKLSPNICAQSFQLISDPLGRGIEISKKSTKIQELSFSIENGAEDCQNIAAEPQVTKVDPPVEEPKKDTPAEVKKEEEPKKDTPAEVKKEEEPKKDAPAETKKTEKTPESECKEKIEKDLDETGRPLNQWKWDEKAKNCLKKESKDEKEDGTEADNVPTQRPAPANKPASRFQPISIPTRQIYILPGMP